MGRVLFLCPGSFFNVCSSPTACICFLFFYFIFSYLSQHRLYLRGSNFQGDDSIQGSEEVANRLWMTAQILESSCHTSIPAQPHSNHVTLSKLFNLLLSQLLYLGSGLPRWPSDKESTCNAGDVGLIPGSGRSPGVGNSNLLQYSCLGNAMDRGAWRATLHGVAKSWT